MLIAERSSKNFYCSHCMIERFKCFSRALMSTCRCASPPSRRISDHPRSNGQRSRAAADQRSRVRSATTNTCMALAVCVTIATLTCALRCAVTFAADDQCVRIDDIPFTSNGTFVDPCVRISLSRKISSIPDAAITSRPFTTSA